MQSKKAAIAANRFGLGARPRDADAVGASPEAWLYAQLEAAARIEALSEPASAATLQRVSELQLARRVRLQAQQQSDQPPEISRDMIREFGQFMRGEYMAQASQRCVRAIETDQPFAERLVHFWSNHFAISTDKQPLGAIAGHYENEAIRPHIAGNFLDMLRAVEHHPAMILYLDNQASIGPSSRAAQAARRRRNRELGLNENLAREILELHTLGVDGGYDQSDVTEFARILTGWSIGGDTGPLRGGEPGRFYFRPLTHEPGDKTVIGKHFREDGVGEGEDVLEMLALHPATARHIATKLARHFVADEPPTTLVERLTAAYLESGGELLPVYRTLIDAEESWEPPFAKFKTPQDFVISAYRALDIAPNDARQVVGLLAQLGQPPMRPGSPAGWPDTAAHWDGGDALLKRIEWGRAVGHRAAGRVDPRELAGTIIAPLLGESTAMSIRQAESAGQGLTLLFAAPEFQRR